MMRFAAVLWLAVVVMAGAYLGLRAHRGLTFRTDLLALLPREEQDPATHRAKDAVTRALSQRVVVLIGHPDRDQARAAAAALSRALAGSGLAEITTTGLDRDRLRQLGELYFLHRRGLLSESDRLRLQEGRGEEISRRALSQMFGFIGLADASLVRRDPFLLMPAFLADLPVPTSRLSLDEGVLSLRADGATWVMVAVRLTGEPFALDFQRRFVTLLERTVGELRTNQPALEVLRLGAVFFARAGAEEAVSETSQIGLASMAGTVILVLAVFRAFTPLWLSLLAIGVGAVSALSLSLWIFGELHVAVLLFGVSLIGVAVDYSLHYCCEVFSGDPAPPRLRLTRVMPGITLGLVTTLIGYGTFLLAPFPGLHQVALFSVIGLIAAFATVVLWLPDLDRGPPVSHGAPMTGAAARYWAFWQGPRSRAMRTGLLVLLAVLAMAGAPRLHADDDVRRMQSLSPQLIREQERIQRLIGAGTTTQFFIVQAADDEAALQAEEIVAGRLRPLQATGALAGFQAPASFVPSAARQRENRLLVRERLEVPFLATHAARVGLVDLAGAAADSGPVLDLAAATRVPASAGLLSNLVVEGGGAGVTHVVVLDGISRPDDVARAAEGVEGVHFADMAGDFSRLLAKYRQRAVLLVGLSGLLMLPLLAWRYGLGRGLRVMAPPTAAAVLTPAIHALTGRAFTFFDAMALVLVLSVGVDYAIFSAESTRARMPRTLVAVWVSALTTLMSFGLLALSRVVAVHAFGSTMLLGIALAALTAPLAGCRAERRLVADRSATA